jgi:IgGFc binding protein
MTRTRAFGRAGSAILLAGLIAAAACGHDRSPYVGQRELVIDADASVPDAPTPTCGLQCSIDGRSVIQTCTGEIVETCPPDLACGGARCQEPCAAAAADRSSNGCEFYFQMPRYSPKFPQSCYAAFLVNASTKPITLALDREGEVLDLSKALFRTNPGETALIPLEGPIPPGESAILFVADRPPNVPWEFGYIACPDGVVPAALVNVGSGTRLDTAFHLKSSAPVGAVTMYPFGGAASYIPSATLLFPVATWGKEHLIVNGWESIGVNGSTTDPAAQIVASEDGTEVTINPTADIQDGVGVAGTGARIPRTYRLDKGELLQLVQTEELSGSIVSSNKPTTVFGGHSCALIPGRVMACDTLHQQLPPFEQWGNEYVGVGYRPRLKSEHEPMPYRIVAARDGTVLDYDPAVPPGAPITMSAGEVVTFTSGTGDAFVVRSQDSEHPFYLAAYMSGNDPGFGGHGDPEFVNVVPTHQYLSSYSFYADPTYDDSSLVVVRARTGGAFKDVWLECAGNLTDFQPIGTRGKYEFTRVDLARNGGPGATFGDKVCQNGLQRMRSEGPFTATVWGWAFCASYAYPGGMAQRKLVDTPLVDVH